MPSYIYSSGINKVISNGKVLEDKSYEMKYDGKELDIKKTNKNKTKKIKLTEKDIAQLLQTPPESLSLEERLVGELNKSHSKHKTKQNKKNKTKKNKTKKTKGGAKKKNETQNINVLAHKLNENLQELKKLLGI
tara:strand:+ start:423 stop:824 length:402 start_codon:yes stop_codon:yes gene_type:complete